MVAICITGMICLTVGVIAFFDYKKETATKGEEDKEE